jgi:hypothetical protein
MRPDDRIRVLHMIEATEAVEAFVAGRHRAAAPIVAWSGVDGRIPRGIARQIPGGVETARALQNLQPQMRVHRVEIAVVVQQRVALLDAERANDQVGRLADGDALAPQHAVIMRRLHGNSLIQHRHDIERSQVPRESNRMGFIARALQHLQHDNVTDQESFSPEQRP